MLDFQETLSLEEHRLQSIPRHHFIKFPTVQPPVGESKRLLDEKRRIYKIVGGWVFSFTSLSIGGASSCPELSLEDKPPPMREVKDEDPMRISFR
jgi:hypothetical protein